jgi:hypothetical protein
MKTYRTSKISARYAINQCHSFDEMLIFVLKLNSYANWIKDHIYLEMKNRNHNITPEMCLESWHSTLTLVVILF